MRKIHPWILILTLFSGVAVIAAVLMGVVIAARINVRPNIVTIEKVCFAYACSADWEGEPEQCMRVSDNESLHVEVNGSVVIYQICEEK